MKKVLMLASVASMIDQFNMPNIGLLRRQGYEVHVAANFVHGSTSSKKRIDEFKKELKDQDIPYYQIDFSRNVADIVSNIKAYKQLKALMKKYNYEFVHCHSPIGGVCGRIAGNRTKTKVIYTAHGFHFCKGAPIINWLLYYPVERWLANFTDVLITINKEDYNRSKRFSAKRNVYVPGVGIDTKKHSRLVVNPKKRSEIGVSEDAFLILSVGELNKNKNQETIIKAVAKLDNPKINYVICGQGPLEPYLRKLIKELGIENQVKLLGFRNDIAEIYKVANVFCFPSFREGLSVALMEVMSSGLPVICSNIRGNSDLIQEGRGGYLVEPDNVNGFVNALQRINQDDNQRESMGRYNKKVILDFDIENVLKDMKKIYSEV